MSYRFLALAVILSSLSACRVSAATYVIEADGSGDFATIQAAIAAASDTDVIELADGIFTGDGNRDVSFMGKAITVRSQSDDPSTCVIDCAASALEFHRGFVFQSGEGTGSVLRGVSITNGHVHNSNQMGGGGVYILDASPMIVNCFIWGNTVTAANYNCEGAGIAIWGATAAPAIDGCTIAQNNCGVGGSHLSYGGGIYCRDGAPIITGCAVEDNATRNNGGGICLTNSSAQVTGCSFARNEASEGAGGSFSGNFSVEDCIFVANVASGVGGGARVAHGTFTNCTFVGNLAGTHGGGVWSEYDDTAFERTIIAFSAQGEGVYEAEDRCRHMSFTCCDVFGNAGGEYGGLIDDQTGINGNISEDPRFCNVFADDFTLCANSPCLPDGNGCAVQIGAEGEGCGECDSPTTTRTWGRIKMLYH